jgi:hypothetical protein
MYALILVFHTTLRRVPGSLSNFFCIPSIYVYGQFKIQIIRQVSRKWPFSLITLAAARHRIQFNETWSRTRLAKTIFLLVATPYH